MMKRRFSPGLQHSILQEFAEEVRVAAGDGGTRRKLFLLHSLCHLHEELGHLRQRQVDLHALALRC